MLALLSTFGLAVATTAPRLTLAQNYNADLPWDGSATGLTPSTLSQKYKTHILDQRWPEAGPPSDYICINGDYITTIVDDNAKFESNRDGKLIRTDLVQAFQQPEGSQMLYKTSMLKQSMFTNSKKYQVFFTEGKLFEIHIDTTIKEKPVFKLFIQSPEEVWSGPMEYNTKYNFGILVTSGQAGSVEFYMSSGDDQLAPVPGAKKQTNPNLNPEFHFGMLIWEANGATIQGKDSLAFAGVSVSTVVDFSAPSRLTGGECGGAPVPAGGPAQSPITPGASNSTTVSITSQSGSPPPISTGVVARGGSPGPPAAASGAGGSGSYSGGWSNFWMT